MPLRELGKADSAERQISTSVCVVGAGIAGLIAATKLARLGLSVVLLESGRQGGDGNLPPPDCVDGSVLNDGGPRHRGVGGNSLLWGGKLLPLSEQDTRSRSYLELDGWPWARSQIERYRREIEDLMGLDHESFEEDACHLLDPSALLPRHDADFVLRWPKMPTAKNYNLAHVLRREVASRGNLSIWTDATACGFDVDKTSGKLLALKGVSTNGRALEVRATEYLITAGTLESTRLLLLLDRHVNETMSRGGLGRYFNDHLGVNVAALRPRSEKATNRTFADRFLLASRRHLHFEMTPALQRRTAVSSGYFDIGIELSESSGLSSAKRLIQSLRTRRLDFRLSDVRAIASGMPAVAQAAGWRYFRMQKFWPPNASMNLKFWIEQTPRYGNRLYLSGACDSIGLPLLKIDWASGEAEEKTIDVLYKATRAYWARHFSEICALEWRPDFLEPGAGKAALATGHAHPAGTTRMGTNPNKCVVDSDLAVYAVPNVSVASASVFPASGSANPTYTIMQIAMRAADAIVKRLRPVERPMVMSR